MKLLRKTVSAPFRQLVSSLYPGLDNNRSYWRLFGYLLFGGFFDKDTGNLVIGQGLLAEIEGNPVTHCKVIDLLEAFRRDVMTPETFKWTHWKAKQNGGGKCRQVEDLVLDPALEQALTAERLKLNHGAGRVYFADGTAYSRAKEQKEREARQGAAMATLKKIKCELAAEILSYLNDLPPHLFTKLRQNLPDAIAVASALSNRRVRDAQLRILGLISDQPQPFYAPSPKGRTVRLFGVGECLASLKREVRYALTQGTSEADLTNSQLAICAKLWNVPEVEIFLASGQSIWVHFCEQLGYKPEDKAWLKDAFKEPLYSACFGMPKPSVQAEFTKNLKAKGIEGGGARLMQSPLLLALFRARGREAAKIQADEGGLTCFKKWIDLSETVDVNSILAQQAQAVELSLIHPIIKLAKEHPKEFTVLLWQHDGVTIHFHRRAEHWKKEINGVVQRQIETLEIKTRLEWKDNQRKEGGTTQEKNPQAGRKGERQGREKETSLSNHRIGTFQRRTRQNLFTNSSQVLCPTK